MKSASLVLIVAVLFGLPSFARENCEGIAKDAALLLSNKINGDNRGLSGATTKSDTAKEQVVEVIVDDIQTGGAHIGYTVTVERNSSRIEANQTCLRVTKIELTSEE